MTDKPYCEPDSQEENIVYLENKVMSLEAENERLKMQIASLEAKLGKCYIKAIGRPRKYPRARA